MLFIQNKKKKKKKSGYQKDDPAVETNFHYLDEPQNLC